MSRPPKPKTLYERVCAACAAVGPVPKRGRNEKYPYQLAAHVAAEFRQHLFKNGVLLLADQGTPEYVTTPTNGGEQLTECRLSVKFILTDGKETIGPHTYHGVGRDLEDKALYKATTGAQKYYLRGLGLIPDEEDDAEYDGPHAGPVAGETGEAARAPRRIPKREQPIRVFEIHALQDAFADTQKSEQEVSEAMLTRFKVVKVCDLRRWQFKDALAWASNGAGTIAPKPQAAPALQNRLPLPAPPVEMRIGQKTVQIPAQKDSFAL